jgi:nitrate/nitrite-specific signal transduction histidine kinase
VIALLAAILSLFLARTITTPLAGLVKTAMQVADGDIQQEAEVGRRDEIGVLAEAFNRMTHRLRELINNLEAQVSERTSYLQWQTIQLETSTKVSREITSILDTDKLLDRVVELIQQAFEYYHVGIYLVDEQAGYLSFMAGTGEVSRAWKAGGRRLLIGGESLSGKAALENRTLVANDAAQDAHFLKEEALPDTMAELVVPLRIGNRVLGTLDVQSTQRNSFCAEDINIIQSLGEQVAIAIENARLYDRIRDLATTEERQRLARELHDSVTQSLYGLVLFSGAGSMTLEAGDLASTRQYMVRIAQTANEALKEMRLLLYQLRSAEMEWGGLVGALRQRLEAVEDRMGIQTRITAEGSLDLPAPVGKALFGIAQEALNNALRHSSARTVTVHIAATHGSVELEVKDDGVGFDLQEACQRGGMGLLGMRERAEHIRGTLKIQSIPGEGTLVSARAPLSAPQPETFFQEEGI